MAFRPTEQERATLEAQFLAALASGQARCGFCDKPLLGDNAIYRPHKNAEGELCLILSHRECAPTTQSF